MPSGLWRLIEPMVDQRDQDEEDELTEIATPLMPRPRRELHTTAVTEYEDGRDSDPVKSYRERNNICDEEPSSGERYTHDPSKSQCIEAH